MKAKSLALVVGLIFCGIVCSQVPAAREVSQEAVIFRKTRDAVFTIYGDRGHGSGFLVDKVGLILTNSHVIASSSRISVQLNPKTRVPATLLAEDKQKDIAVLRVAPEIVEELPILKIADRSSANLAFEGEKVIAIGSPLNQIRILTSGIVSKVEERVIISDVNINQGNSGGPLINMDSEVIAINTFGDVPLRGSGPGVSGSISISLALPLLDQARGRLHEEPPPSTLLPVVPEDSFPIEGLKWAAERCGQASNYTLKAPGFNIQISTPSRWYFRQKISMEPLTEKRRSREAAAGVNPSKMYDPLRDRFREWREYVGDYSPLVTITIEPSVGQTGGSLLLNMLGAAAAGYSGTPYYYGSYTYEFKSDLQDAELMDGGNVVPEVLRAMGIMPVSISERSIKMEDIAQRGVFMFLPEMFKSPNLRLKILDLKKPGQVINVPIPQACREQILADFEPYMDMQNAADAKLRLMVAQ
ncbi:hypothetical protein C6502_09855 [Candidatus Poribacteria bacterium]|nr:MAG: hypothetical protein C6502_09855 [Candidatus Poribacteria bacterium]